MAQRVCVSASDSNRVLPAADILRTCRLHNLLGFYCRLTISAKQLVLFGLALQAAGPCVTITSPLRGTTAGLLCSLHAEAGVTAMPVKWATSRDRPAQPDGEPRDRCAGKYQRCLQEGERTPTVAPRHAHWSPPSPELVFGTHLYSRP